jgi:hypothetical protein
MKKKTAKKASTTRKKAATKTKKVAAKAKPARAKVATKSAKNKPIKAKAKVSSKSKAAGADWREATLDRMRTLIEEADPQVVEEVKWRKPSNGMRGVPVWSHHGIVCTGETYKAVVKLTFAQGASLPDPSGLFNTGFGGGTRRAIDIREGEQVDATAFKALINVAVAHNALTKAR